MIILLFFAFKLLCLVYFVIGLAYLINNFLMRNYGIISLNDSLIDIS